MDDLRGRSAWTICVGGLLQQWRCLLWASLPVSTNPQDFRRTNIVRIVYTSEAFILPEQQIPLLCSLDSTFPKWDPKNGGAPFGIPLKTSNWGTRKKEETKKKNLTR